MGGLSWAINNKHPQSLPFSSLVKLVSALSSFGNFLGETNVLILESSRFGKLIPFIGGNLGLSKGFAPEENAFTFNK